VPHTTCRRVLMIFMMRHAFVPDRDKRGGLAPGVRGGLPDGLGLACVARLD
jgi:hypothetical protein